jgi:drug/metabolite transporter (DMT)-like permease
MSQSTHLINKLPGQAYLWFAVILFAASNSIIRKLTDIGAQNLIDGRNPISPCNVLFVSNLCALSVFLPIFHRQFNRRTLKQISWGEWSTLVIVATLSGALAPALIFTALSLTMVSNVIIVGRIEPPLILALSVWLLNSRLNRWEVIGTFVSLVGVVLTIALQKSAQPAIGMGLFTLGKGEVLTLLGVAVGAIATVISKAKLGHIPLGIYTTVRMIIGTIVFFFLAIFLYGSKHFAEAFSPVLWQWMLLYGIFIVAVGQLSWFKGLRLTTTSEISLANSFSPVAGILGAYLILGEQLTAAHYMGGAIVFIGLLISQIGIWRNSSPKERKVGLWNESTPG